MLGDTVRRLAIVADFLEIEDRALAAGGFARDGDNDAFAFGQRHTLFVHARASIFPEGQEAVLVAQAKIEKGATAPAIDLAHASAIKFAPARAASLIACTHDAESYGFAASDQRFARLANAGVDPGFQRLAH
ncbi:MAG: hypothetical protein HY054_06260 [Proteobacteria bacterium]|nr:hypothetical protein [Pseudomonadota bacterium]